MANEPRYDSRLLAQGTAQAEYIHNELIGRVAAAHMRIKSRTTTAPPAAVDYDAYHIPQEATGAWSTHLGEIAIWLSGWKYMNPRAGMRLWIENEGITVEWREPNAPGYAGNAINGFYEITPGPTITFNGAKGTSASVELDQNAILEAPSGTIPGQLYTLYIRQPGVGGPFTLSYDTNDWLAPSAMALTASANAIDVYTFLASDGGVYPATEISRNLNMQLQ